LTEEGEKVVAASYARALALSFQVQVNDNLDALGRAIRNHGVATAELKGRLILTALLSQPMADGQPLFHASHNNLAQGADVGPPDVPRLSAARLALRHQKMLGSELPMGLAPAVALVPAELETLMDTVLNSTTYPGTPSEANPFLNKGIRNVVESRLADPLGWMIFPDPAVLSVHPVCHLGRLRLAARPAAGRVRPPWHVVPG
jgi:hypothetical protein